MQKTVSETGKPEQSFHYTSNSSCWQLVQHCNWCSSRDHPTRGPWLLLVTVHDLLINIQELVCAQLLSPQIPKTQKAARVDCLFTLLGSAGVKAAHKMLVKLIPGDKYSRTTACIILNDSLAKSSVVSARPICRSFTCIKLLHATSYGRNCRN